MDYDNAMGTDVLYHYAAEEGVSTTEDEPGYISTIEYEEPLEPSKLQYATTTRPLPNPTVPERYPPIHSQKNIDPPPRSRPSKLGLLGLLGLAGLFAFVRPPTETQTLVTSKSTSVSGCRVGEIVWSIGPVFEGFMIANGSAFDPTVYPDLGTILPDGRLPLLINRYPRGTIAADANKFFEAELDTSSVNIKITDPGHMHTEAGATYGVLRDGSYTLAHLYSFDTDGMNLKESGPIITKGFTNIEAELENKGTETRPASLGLVPLICSGNKV